MCERGQQWGRDVSSHHTVRSVREYVLGIDRGGIVKRVMMDLVWGEGASKMSALSWVSQGSTFDVDNPLTLSFLEGGSKRWGVRPLFFVFICVSSLFVSSLAISSADNEP